MIASGRPPGAKKKTAKSTLQPGFWSFYLRDRLAANLVILEQPLVFASLAPMYKHKGYGLKSAQGWECTV